MKTRTVSAPVTHFDPARVLAERPWFERALGAVAPSWEVKRMQARVQKHLFEYQAAQADRLFNPRTSGVSAENGRTARDRITMMFEARDLVENFGPAKVILNKFAENITPTEYAPQTGDRDYDRIVADYFHDWCRKCDFEGRHSFRKLVEIAVQTRPVDGDCGFILRRMEGEALRLQLVAGDRIGSPTEVVVSDNYFSGIGVDKFGRPMTYRIFRVARSGQYTDPEEIGRDSFFHYADQFRADQYRGVTDFHSCLRTARMIKDILEAEQVGVKFASQQAALIFNDTGAPQGRNLFSVSGSPTLPNGETRKDEYTEYGALRYLQKTDRVEVMPSRPGTAFEGFTELLMEHFAMGVGVAPGVLFGTQDYKGPSVRAEFAQADRAFSRHKSNLCTKVLEPSKDAVLLNAIAIGELPMPKRADGETPVQTMKRALRGAWRFPAKLTIDVGRESEANVNENMIGAKSLQEIAAEQDADAFDRIEQNAQIAAFVSDMAEKYEVPETAIRLVGKQLPNTPTAAAANGEKVGEDAAAATAASTNSAGKAAGSGGAKPEGSSRVEKPEEMSRVADALAGRPARNRRSLDALLGRAQRLAAIREKMNAPGRTAAEVTRILDPLRIRGVDVQLAEQKTAEDLKHHQKAERLRTVKALLHSGSGKN